MNYIGSKLSLLEFIENSIFQVVDGNCSVFCDLFAGTGAVGSHFKKKGFKIIANDLQYYSYVLNRHYIGNHNELDFQNLSEIIPELQYKALSLRRIAVCEYLNSIEGTEGFIYNNYCSGGSVSCGEERQYFSDENGMRCDAIRQEIEMWMNKEYITDDEYFFLVTSLLESVDKYANTASVYGAFLKKLKRTAQNRLIIKPAELIINDRNHEVYCGDINSRVEKISGDIVYLDPPYNHRQYAANYHILETIAKYDNPIIYGKTGLRGYKDQKSLYCSKTEVKKTFVDLISKLKAKYIFLSYNNEGLLLFDDIREILSKCGEYGCFYREYNRFKADRPENRYFKYAKTVEYLHYVIVNT